MAKYTRPHVAAAVTFLANSTADVHIYVASNVASLHASIVATSSATVL